MITLSLNSEPEVLSENDEQLQSNGGSDGVKYLTMIGPSDSGQPAQSSNGSIATDAKYLTMIGPRDSGQPAQSSNGGSATGAKYLTIVGSKDSGQSPQLSARDSGQLPQSSNVGTLGYMKLSFTQSQPGLGDEEYMELDGASQLHASCEARLNIDSKNPNQPESTVHDDDTYQPLLQLSKQPNNGGYMKVDKHTSCFATPQSTGDPVYEATQM